MSEELEACKRYLPFEKAVNRIKVITVMKLEGRDRQIAAIEFLEGDMHEVQNSFICDNDDGEWGVVSVSYKPADIGQPQHCVVTFTGGLPLRPGMILIEKDPLLGITPTF